MFLSIILILYVTSFYNQELRKGNFTIPKSKTKKEEKMVRITRCVIRLNEFCLSSFKQVLKKIIKFPPNRHFALGVVTWLFHSGNVNRGYTRYKRLSDTCWINYVNK